MEIQKIFSDMYDEERIYSVLMNEDEIALFSDLCEYLYSDDETSKKKLSTGAKVGLGVAGAGLGTAAGIYGANKAGKALMSKAEKLAADHANLINMAKSGTLTKKEQEVADKLIKSIDRRTKAGQILAYPGEKVAVGYGKAASAVKSGYGKAAGAVKSGYGKAAGAIKAHKKLAAGIAAGTALAGAGIGTAAYLHNKKKSQD